jgi:hypothetical protein
VLFLSLENKPVGQWDRSNPTKPLSSLSVLKAEITTLWLLWRCESITFFSQAPSVGSGSLSGRYAIQEGIPNVVTLYVVTADFQTHSCASVGLFVTHRAHCSGCSTLPCMMEAEPLRILILDAVLSVLSFVCPWHDDQPVRETQLMLQPVDGCLCIFQPICKPLFSWFDYRRTELTSLINVASVDTLYPRKSAHGLLYLDALSVDQPYQTCHIIVSSETIQVQMSVHSVRACINHPFQCQHRISGTEISVLTFSRNVD